MRRHRRRCRQTRRFRRVSANATFSCADRSCSCAVRVSCSERLKSYGAPRPRRGRARGASCPARLSGRVSSRNSDRRASTSSRNCTPRLQRLQRRPTRRNRHRKRRASPLPVRLPRSLNGLARRSLSTRAFDACSFNSSSQEEVEGNADEMVADPRLARRSGPRRFDPVQAGVGQGQGTHGGRLCARAGSLAGAYRDCLVSRAPNPDPPWRTRQVHVIGALPLRSISRLYGLVNSYELPVWFRVPGYKFYSWVFGVNLDECEPSDLTEYRSMSEFFMRRLKPGVRPIADAPLVSRRSSAL